MKPMTIPEGLRDLGAAYERAGHEIWLVGGVVRDHILGLPSKDVDLATSATPEEQVAIADAAGYRWYATGLKHGTLTVLVDGEPYEITTFRTDVETDGRHATVAYTRDLAEDLSRRDLTMNAIALSFDGEMIDPYGGAEDALAGRVRFVGDAGQRIREDYLRILRFFRFAGRFAADIHGDLEDLEAVAGNAGGLSRISVERVWSEMRRILSGPRPYGVIDVMARSGVLDTLGVPAGDTDRLARMRPHTDDATILLAAWLGEDAVEVAERWKTSNDEKSAVAFAASRMETPYDLAMVKADLVGGADRRWVEAVMRMRRMDAEYRAVADWDPPAFPVQGRDIVAAGMKPGPAVGDAMRQMERAWVSSDYTMTGPQLLATLDDV
jgi:poly(A) polymerase